MSPFLIIAALASAHIPFPMTAGQCGWVHGRFSIWNGSSIRRVWVRGTHHLLALHDEDDHYPPALRRLVDAKDYRIGFTDIDGEFRACALEPWARGRLQHIRLLDARDLSVRQRLPNP